MFNLRNYAWLGALLLATSMLSSCSTVPSVSSRQLAAASMATEAGWSKQVLQTADFDLLSYVPSKKAVDTLTIYIEGDGLAWLSRRQPSLDPTPINPVALSLALADTQHHAVYLARPCQYVSSSSCQQIYWTTARFSEEVVASTNQAINQLKQQFKSSHIRLVGFSGGAAVAALVAARRDDVRQLITVAGNLNPEMWTQLHHVSPLSRSLTPMDVIDSLKHIHQIHFVGSDDKVMPIEVAQSYVAAFPDKHKPKLKRIANMSHGCCWAQSWPRLLKSIEQIE